MPKFPNPTSTSNLIKRLKPFDKGPKKCWFPIMSQPKGSIHRFEIVDKKHSSGLGIQYIEGKCIESPKPENIGTVVRLDRNGPLVRRSSIVRLLEIDTHVGGHFALQYKHDTQNAYLIKDPGE